MDKWKNSFFEPIELEDIRLAFLEEFNEHIASTEDIEVEGEYKETEIYISIILKNEDESFYYPVEAVIHRKENKELSEQKAKDILLDFIASYYFDYFSTDRDTYLPIDWAPYEFMGAKLYAKGQVINKKLEQEADKLLSKFKLKE